MTSSGWTIADTLTLGGILASLVVGAAVVLATYRGPIVAARQADARREAADRRADKMKVFRELMGHRYDVLHPTFVAALNLVQIEFAESQAVLTEYEKFLSAFHPDKSDRPNVGELRLKAVIHLISAVGSDLGYKLEKLDLMDQVYSPQRWAEIVDQQNRLRAFLTEIADGKKAVPVVLPGLVDLADETQAALRVRLGGARE